MRDYYILNEDHTVTPVGMDEYFEWTEKYGGLKESDTNSRKIIGKYNAEDDKYRVSTVFLGINHAYTEDMEPMLFETMVFDGPMDGEMNRYSTWEEALEGHVEMIRICGGKEKKDKENIIDSRFDILDL